MLVEVNGVQLFYEKTGQGRPLFMVHGNGEDHHIFDEAAAVLQNHFTVYAIDSRGHGQSSPVRELHYLDMARDVLAMIEQLDLHDVVFYGFSDGGIVGLLLASMCDRLSALIVSGANTQPNGVTMRLSVLLHIDWWLHHDDKVKLMLQEPHIEDAALQSITVPTLVLAGSKDLIRTRHTRHLAAMLPHSCLKILPGQTHGSYIVHQTRIAELILDFTSSLPK